MSLYLGSQQVTPIITSGALYGLGGANPLKIFSKDYSTTLANTNYSSLTPSTSSQTLQLPATTYTTTPSTSIIIDRVGNGYNDIVLESLQIYSYFAVCNTVIQVSYTQDESTLTMPHIIKTAQKDIYAPCLSDGIYQGELTPFWSMTSAVITATVTGVYRNASGVLNTSGSYGIYPSSSSASVSSGSWYSDSKNHYIDIKLGSIYIRAHSSYHDLTAFDYINPNNTTIVAHWDIYRCDRPNLYEYTQSEAAALGALTV